MILQIIGYTLLIVALLPILVFLFLLIKGTSKKRPKIDPSYEEERGKHYPPAYPNGWFNLCASSDVKKGQVIEVDAFGQKLAVFRGKDGKVGVLDIYCPHLNANLADGFVRGNNLVCPFHEWEFNADGGCEKIPYCEKVPHNAKTSSWVVQENWGLVLVWYHNNQENPTWTTESYMPEIKDYKYHGKTSDILHIHLQDFAENGADYAHFKYVHDLLTIPFAEHFIDIKHTLKIEFGTGEEKHLAWFYDQADLLWKKSGLPIPYAAGKAKVTYYGPGFLVFRFDSHIAKDVVLIKTFTPLGNLKLRMDDYIYAPKSNFKVAVNYILREASAQFMDDIRIWERKNFAKQPMLVDGDGPIIKMRTWYSQFYEEQNELVKEEVVQN